jgi:hypothetical protein
MWPLRAGPARSHVAVVAACCVASALATVPPAGADEGYEPPVDAPVVDPYRPPTHPYGPGNRGIDYGTEPGDPVHAAGAGRVVFAGPVAGALHVTLLHPDGLRTSYSFLGRVDAAVGREVRRGDRIGVAGGRFHFGVRAGARYLDPALLFGESDGLVRLVPLDDRAGEPWTERLALLGGGSSAWGHYSRALLPLDLTVGVAHGLDHWWDQRERCTREGDPLPPPRHPRVLVLVGGLGSSSAEAAVDAVDVSGLGFAAEEVVRFSYAGGAVPGPGASAMGLPTSEYRSVDTQGFIDGSGRRLAELLAAIGRARPGVPIEVVAHSQGGLVARLALHRHSSATAPPVHHLVTIGSPHGGADLATAVATFGSDPRGRAGARLLGGLLGIDIEADAPAVADLSETSTVVEVLARGAAAGEPAGRARVTSVAARGDLVVPVPRTDVAGADHVVLPVSGPTAHDDLPGHPRTTVAVARALAGQRPACEPLADVLADRMTGELISAAETRLGAHAALVAAASPP